MSKKRNRIKTIFIMLLILAVALYVSYQIFFITRSDIRTETAMFTEISETIETTGTILREETILEEPQSGVLNYLVGDGEKISKSQVIADIYPSQDSARIQSQILNIESEIEGLQSLKTSEEYFLSETDHIGEDIDEEIVNILSALTKNDYTQTKESAEDLQYSINQRKIILGEEEIDDYTYKIDQLTSQRDELLATQEPKIGTMYSQYSGYFASTTDGYENAFDIDNIEYITVADIANLTPTQTTQSSAKILNEFSWYMVSVIDQNEYAKLQGVTDVEIEAPFTTKERLPAEIVAVNRDATSGEYALVLKCSYMDNDIALAREENINIIVEEHAGVLVNEKAIYFEDVVEDVENEDGTITQVVHENVKGVFIKYGQTVEFVQVFSDITINGYAVCKQNLDEDETKLLVTRSTIQVYDEVIVEGANLYDGKVL